MTRKLKIAQIAPLYEAVPPKKYGGTERVVYELTEELVKRGHDVTLFASADSKTNANLESVCQRSLWSIHANPQEEAEYGMLNIGRAYSKQHDFDIIHDHNGISSFPVANIATTPVVMTMHGEFTNIQRGIIRELKIPRVITISESQAHILGDDLSFSTVYNGLTMDNYPFSATHDGYLLYVGRVCPEKGTHIAIEVAEKLKIPLIIAAKVHEKDTDYFNKYVKPHLDNHLIKFIGEVDQNSRNILMSKALAFLHPTNWNEPFGLTLIEAMACGAPVVAINKGSIAEIVCDGKTGFVVKNADEMIKAIRNVDKIDRAYCRKYSIENFNAKKMADKYENIYYQILEESKYKTIIGKYPRRNFLALNNHTF